MGNDPQKTQLCLDLPKVFDALKQYYGSHPEVTGAELYPYAHQCAEASGWLFGGVIAGHIVGEFPHALLPGDKDLYRINPANIEPMRSPDALGQTKFWILEVHLVDRTRSWGAFYERILRCRPKDVAAADIPIVLGGPIAVYDCAACPFLEQEVAILQSRLAHRPEQVRMLEALPFWLSCVAWR